MDKIGFWVQYHIELRNSDEKEYGYNFYLYEDGYKEDDEESLKMDVQSWAENEKGMWAKDYYRYGYEVMKVPPIEHINNKIKQLKKELEYYKSFIENK